MLVALEQNRVDAVSIIEPFMTQLAEKHKVRVIAPVELRHAELAGEFWYRPS